MSVPGGNVQYVEVNGMVFVESGLALERPRPVVVDRRLVILREAAFLQQRADYEDGLIGYCYAPGDASVRDAYRDMASALCLLADERGT